MASAPEFQHTLSKAAGFSGTSLHTGEKVSLKLHPAPADHGIKFKRKDLPDEPTIDAKIDNLKMVERATTIGEGSMRVHTNRRDAHLVAGRQRFPRFVHPSRTEQSFHAIFVDRYRAGAF